MHYTFIPAGPNEEIKMVLAPNISVEEIGQEDAKSPQVVCGLRCDSDEHSRRGMADVPPGLVSVKKMHELVTTERGVLVVDRVIRAVAWREPACRYKPSALYLQGSTQYRVYPREVKTWKWIWFREKHDTITVPLGAMTFAH